MAKKNDCPGCKGFGSNASPSTYPPRSNIHRIPCDDCGGTGEAIDKKTYKPVPKIRVSFRDTYIKAPKGWLAMTEDEQGKYVKDTTIGLMSGYQIEALSFSNGYEE